MLVLDALPEPHHYVAGMLETIFLWRTAYFLKFLGKRLLLHPHLHWVWGLEKWFLYANLHISWNSYQKVFGTWILPPSRLDSRNIIFCEIWASYSIPIKKLIFWYLTPSIHPCGVLETWFFCADLHISCNSQQNTFLVLDPHILHICRKKD